MPKFSNTSQERINTCHKDLQTLFNTVIQFYDCTVLYGNRSVEEQQELFAQGRTKPGNIVTYLDGVNKKSKHNFVPALAADVVPYPIDWNNEERFNDFGWFVLAIAKVLKDNGAIDNDIEWGGRWRPFKDLPHFQIKS